MQLVLVKRNFVKNTKIGINFAHVLKHANLIIPSPKSFLPVVFGIFMALVVKNSSENSNDATLLGLVTEKFAICKQ